MACISAFATLPDSSAFFWVDRQKVDSPPWRTKKIRPCPRASELGPSNFFSESAKNSVNCYSGTQQTFVY
jgi:hypothetical protein